MGDRRYPELPRTKAMLRRDTRDPRRRTWTPARIELLRAIAAEPGASLRMIERRLGISHSPCWGRAQRCVRDGLLIEDRPIVDGKPARHAKYRLTEKAMRVVLRGVA